MGPFSLQAPQGTNPGGVGMLGFNIVSNKDLFQSKTLVDIYLQNKCKYMQIYLSLYTSIILYYVIQTKKTIIKISKYSSFKKH